MHACISRFRAISISSVRKEDQRGKICLLDNSMIGRPPTNHVRSVVPEILDRLSVTSTKLPPSLPRPTQQMEESLAAQNIPSRPVVTTTTDYVRGFYFGRGKTRKIYRDDEAGIGSRDTPVQVSKFHSPEKTGHTCLRADLFVSNKHAWMHSC